MQSLQERPRACLLYTSLENNVNEHYEIMKKYENENTVEKYMENYIHDAKFHELYLKCSGNRKLVELYHSVNPFIYSNYIFRKQSKEKDFAGVEEHRKIIQAIFDEDEERLRECPVSYTHLGHTVPEEMNS